MNTAEKIKVMQAYEDGKIVEYQIPCRPGWRDMPFVEDPSWNWGAIKYRIKPETLEEASTACINKLCGFGADREYEAFKAGAKWQEVRGND